MDKTIFGVTMALFSLVIVIIVGVAFEQDKKLSEELEQKERKIEALQEENALLHDDVWNLNQALMKGEK